MRSALIGLALVSFAGCTRDVPRETVNVTFTISVDARALRDFAFDLEASVDPDVAWIDRALVRREFVRAATGSLESRGFTLVPAAEAELLISYEFWIEETAGPDSEGAPTRGSIVVRDARSGAFLWRATRKARLVPVQDGASVESEMRAFVEDMLRHVSEISHSAAPR